MSHVYWADATPTSKKLNPVVALRHLRSANDHVQLGQTSIRTLTGGLTMLVREAKYGLFASGTPRGHLVVRQRLTRTCTLWPESRWGPAHSTDYRQDDEMADHNTRSGVEPLPSRPFDAGQFDSKRADRTQASAEPLFQRVQCVASRDGQVRRLTTFSRSSLSDIDGCQNSGSQHVGQKGSNWKFALQSRLGIQLAEGVA